LIFLHHVQKHQRYYRRDRDFRSARRPDGVGQPGLRHLDVVRTQRRQADQARRCVAGMVHLVFRQPLRNHLHEGLRLDAVKKDCCPDAAVLA
jgi:hypothetical protein